MTRRRWKLVAMALVAALACGCLQLEVRIKLDPDGTALVTERVRFSEALLDLAKDKPDLQLTTLLTKDAALERMKRMGKGIALVSHDLREVGGGDKESVAVYKVQDLNEFQYVSPFLAYTDYPQNNIVKCRFEPLMKGRNYGGSAGQLAIAFRLLQPPKGEPRLRPDEAPPKGPSPVELQALREIEPVFREMLKDFRIRFTFESYSPIAHTGFGWRGYKERVRYVDLINFSDQDLDVYGGKFLENEEIMLDLIRWKLGSKNVTDTTYAFMTNASVPVFLPWGAATSRWIQSDEIYIPPSRALFDKYFAGKEIDPSHWGPGPKVPARWEEIGWREGQLTTAPAPSPIIRPPDEGPASQPASRPRTPRSGRDTRTRTPRP